MRCLGGLLAVLLSTAGVVHADDMTSTSFILRGAHLNGAGTSMMTSTAPSPQIGSLGVSVGQPEPLGPAGVAASLRSVFPGYWPIVLGAVPTLDIDADVIPAFLDNCPFWANPAQTPSLDFPSIGLACLCGDVDDNGTFNSLDSDDFRFFLADPFGQPLLAPEKCTVVNTFGVCSIDNVTVMERDLSGRPPFVQERCEAANPP